MGSLYGQHFRQIKIPELKDFISDTLHIELSEETINEWGTRIRVVDSRALNGSILGIQQIKKWKVIPVDQYLAMDASLSNLFETQFSNDSLNLSGTLHVSHLILWYDNQQALTHGLCLNAYTTFHDSLDNPISNWIWEIRVKRERKEEEALFLARVVRQLIKDQSSALSKQNFNPEFYPYLFRRQLLSWSEFIYLKDGYALNVHFTLDFPPDQKSKWQRGSPGIFYRKSAIHESIAMGGKDQKWYWRISPSWIAKTSTTFRLGFNNFERGHFDHLEFQNFLYVNVSALASVEYLPIFHKGLFGGVGIYSGYNFLPDIIPRTELGLLLSLGILLP
ncbi:MAG: hypothetical protein K9N35_07835 [Candidatus Marinimicrobia bacterium]|nr:hypothetical protein [Candidatus Neomarinimicrobiota bacterium]